MVPVNNAIAIFRSSQCAFAKIYQGAKVTEKSRPIWDSKIFVPSADDNGDPAAAADALENMVSQLAPGSYVLEYKRTAKSGNAESELPFFVPAQNQQGVAGIGNPFGQAPANPGMFGFMSPFDGYAAISGLMNPLQEENNRLREQLREKELEEKIEKKLAKHNEYIAGLEAKVAKSNSFENRMGQFGKLVRLIKSETATPSNQQQPAQEQRQQPARQQQRTPTPPPPPPSDDDDSDDVSEETVKQSQAAISEIYDKVGEEIMVQLLQKLANREAEDLKKIANLSEEDLENAIGAIDWM